MFYDLIPISKSDILEMTRDYLCKTDSDELTSCVIEGEYIDQDVKMHTIDLFMSKDIIFEILMASMHLIVITMLRLERTQWETEYAFISRL